MASRCVRSREAEDDGFTLVEVLVAVWIMGAIFVTAFGALFTLIRASDTSRRRTLAEVELRHFAEWVRDAPYVPCDGAGSLTQSTYSSGYTPPESDASVAVTDVQFWVRPRSGSATPDYSPVFAKPGGQPIGTCPGGDTGAQQVTVQLSLGSDSPVIITARVVKRAP